MTIDELKEYVSEINPEAILIDGFDGGLLPYTYSNPQTGTVCFVYSRERCYESTKDTNKWTKEEFDEYWDYNVVRSIPYLDINAPIILEEFS